MKRPPRPRYSRPRLRWIWRDKWVPVHRVSRVIAGKEQVRQITLDWRSDLQRLDAEYWSAEAGRHERQQAPAKQTWRELIEAWRADRRVQKHLADSTKRSYRREMDAILEKNADKPVKATTRQHLRAVHDKLGDTPRKADWRIQVTRLLWNYAQTELDWTLPLNPATGFDLYGTKSAWEPWPAWMVDRLLEAPRAVQIAAELILGTGQRPGAAIDMCWSNFDGEWMTLTDAKRGETFTVFAPESLRAFLATVERRGEHVLAKNLREPLGYDAVQKAFAAWRKTLGSRAAPFQLHGLRKLAIVRLAEAGASDAEIQAITNQSAEMVAYYRRRADRKAMSRAAQERGKP